MSYAPMPVNLERIHDKVAALTANAPTLRDRFAMAAIPYCAGGCTPEEIAAEAYNIADAMMEARNK